MSLIASIISGALGGFAATFAGGLAIDWWNRPILEFDRGIRRSGESSFEESIANANYKIEVKNVGSSVGSNCKSKIILEGSYETTEARVDPHGPDGGEHKYEVSADKHYTIEMTSEWNESESPTRIDLNRDEHSQIDLFRVTTEYVGPKTDISVIFGERCVDSDDVDGFYTEPIRVETYVPEANFEPLVDTESMLSKETFEKIEWETQKVIITSADADKLEGELNISWEDEPLPNVYLSQ